MTQDGSKRKLAAILSADVKGYSLLLADDEAFTIRTLKEYRGIMSNCIEHHNGRVVDSPGDNLLAEFSSVVDAVQCAVEIQKQLKKENERLTENKRLEFRIGVNIGDVVQDGDRIYGNGVNVAARIEGIADPGGICISRNAYDHLKDKFELGFEYLGEHEVKNINEPVRVYKVLLDSDLPKPLVEEPLELPDKPSIAVLPFDNMSGDSSQEYFSDGLTEQIITGLSKIPDLFVISRNSSFAYKGKAINIQKIGKELGIRFVLEGSVQMAGDRVRINAQLIDSTTGHHLWAESYDRDLEDIFAIQDEITLKIMEALNVQLVWGEEYRHYEGSTKNIDAFCKLLQGLECFYRYTEEGNFQARRFCEDATKLDQNYALPYALLGHIHMTDLWFGWSKSRTDSFEQAEKMVKKSLSLYDSLDVPYQVLGLIYLNNRQHEKAIEACERAVTLNPNSAESIAQLAFMLMFSGNPDKAISLLKKAIRLNPIAPARYFNWLAGSYWLIGKFAEAFDAWKTSLNKDPDFLWTHVRLAAYYIATANEKKAQDSVAEILRIDPAFSLDYVTSTLPYKDQSILENLVELLRKAGLPEHSPKKY